MRTATSIPSAFCHRYPHRRSSRSRNVCLARCRPRCRELLAVTSGWEGGPLESVTFAAFGAFGLEGVFPNPPTLAQDGFGNFWIVDLLSTSTTWGPVYYACHDPPVVVYQCADLLTFVQSALTMMDPPFKGPLDEVHEGLTNRIWSTNPGTITRADALTTTDPDTRAFAETLPSTALIVDLRTPKIGDGFSWGRSGPLTRLFRHGEQALFAYDYPPRKSLWDRITGR
jgi:hypothetical protein